MTKRREVLETTDTVRASRSGHTFHERWAARRALQLVFPKDGLKAIAVEGLSSTETAKPGASAEEVADLVLYFGDGENFATSDTVQTVQFKYKTTSGPVTASYLRKTVEKFAASLVGYAKEFSAIDIDRKLTFAFVTNADFSPDLWEAIQGLRTASPPEGKEALKQHSYLKAICTKAGVDAQKLFSRCEFRASEEALPSQNSNLRRTIVDWSAGADLRATARVFALAELVREKAGLQGQRNNLIRREEVLVALGCEEDDLFPADTRFVDVGKVVARKQLGDARDLISRSDLPVFIHADGGFGKTVFVENLAALMSQSHEVVVFDCFGGGAYRSPDQERHVPSVGFIQIANELASRGLCDPLLPGDTENVALANAVRRRLIQASATIRLQSKKEGILIVLDAADNAQLEAENRKDAAFPQLLLASLNSDPIVGVKLVLTARTHRMGGVIGRSKVAPFLLEAFSSDEAYAFLKSRRKDFSDVEFATAYSRSAGNARVLSYLVETWDTNVADNSLKTTITVEQLIKERCDKIIADLHIAGWPDHEVREFFAAISLLPPPIPLEELATALGWPATQVRSAASDLAPMLEIIPSHGAIFRDEPTETFVHDSYSGEASAQQAIAQRLQDAQTTSSYAAEALPSFLVSIKDSGRAYALADSIGFPSAIQSDFGRRRLTLVRLNAAFKLAVDEDDLDRVLSLTMRLAQVAAANSRGDEFIRRSPSLAVVLGDRDAYRRLFADRSGWRGARDVRLTIAHAFSAELDEAEIHGSRAIGWINWNARQPRNEHDHTISRSGPDADDFAAVLFLSVLRGDFESVDRNLSQWSRSFAISVAGSTIKLARQYECALSAEVIDPLADFASTERCKSFALKISLLQSANPLSHRQRKAIAQSLRRIAIKPDKPTGYREDLEGDIIEAAFAALVHDGPRSAGHILRAEVAARPSSYDYGERHGYSKAWLPVFRTCAAAWSQKRAVAIHDLLPSNVKVTRKAKAIATSDDLRAFLSRLPAPPRRDGRRVTRRKKTVTRQFNDRECRDISRGIETVLQLTRTLDTTVRTHGKASSLDEFLAAWQALLPKGVTRAFEEPNQVLCRTVGLGFARLLLQHAPNVTQATADKLIEIVSDARFGIRDRLDVLALLTGKPGLDSRTGKFAQDIASGIRKDDQTDQRGDDYSALADALLTMSVREAQAYYRAGLSELDKLGSGDYDLIYAVLHFAAVKPGGPIRADLGHRLMNLSQTICAHDSGKFGWTLFGRASAKSIGVSAVTKLIRWADQDVAKFSYGLPQLACFLAAENRLKPERAAAFLLLCEDHGWHDWRLGDGLSDLLAATPDLERRRCIFSVIFRKLKAQHSDGGWPSVWESLLDLGKRYPGVVDTFDIEALRGLLADAISKRDEYNSRSFSSERAANIGEPAAERDPEAFLSALLANCDPASASSVDEALAAIESDSTLPYFTKRRLFEKLCETCPYDKRLDHLHALAEASKVPIDNAIDYIEDAVKAWAASSVHIAANIKEVIRSLFRWKGSDLFDLRYGNITRELNQLSTICGDGGFVIRLVLGTISAERVDLDGEEWLQLAAALCHHTSPSSAREALENLLSGPAAGLADEIGEGGYKADFDVRDEQALLSGVFWHLLGDSDSYVRWAVARSLTTLVELGLVEELSALLKRFDQAEVPALKSPEHYLSFMNSQEWLLMGLAKAALVHGTKLIALKPQLLALAARPDVHILHKRHVLRCLVNIGSDAGEIAALTRDVTVDPKGVVVVEGWPEHVPAKSGFSLDYEFTKSEISGLARLFWISEGTVVDLVAEQIRLRWPGAESMNFFPGHDRYRRDRSDRYEFFREHVQKHALLDTATTLRNSRPIARQGYEDASSSPFDEWMRDYDITFNDGSWLADHKDEEPQNAKATFLGSRIEKKDTLVDAGTIFAALGITGFASGPSIPIHGQWRAPDGVYVRIASALGPRRGTIGMCEALSKESDHDLWLPTFWHDGLDDPHRQKSPFEPFVWVRESYGVGIDAGEKAATRGVVSRPRLGVEITARLGLTPDADGRNWTDRGGKIGVRSNVWGEWVPDEDDYRHHFNDDGELLWADKEWLNSAMLTLNRQIVFVISLNKYKKSRSYEEGSGVKAVYVATQPAGQEFRFWFAKKASATIY